MAKAEAIGDCFTPGQTGLLDDAVDAFIDDLLAELAPPETTTTTVP